jgi:hypothetical protein
VRGELNSTKDKDKNTQNKIKKLVSLEIDNEQLQDEVRNASFIIEDL